MWLSSLSMAADVGLDFFVKVEIPKAALESSLFVGRILSAYPLTTSAVRTAGSLLFGATGAVNRPALKQQPLVPH